MESVQTQMFSIETFRSLAVETSSLEVSRVPHNSNLGVDNVIKRATLSLTSSINPLMLITPQDAFEVLGTVKGSRTGDGLIGYG